jgi:hypothetical protein
MRYRCNDAAASGAAASLSRGRSVTEFMPDPKPARIRIVVCAVSKHRTAAQEPRARRPDPHPIRSAPEGSRPRHVCLFACLEFRVPNSAGCRTGGRIAYICNPCSTSESVPHYIGSYDIPFASTVRSGFGCSAPRGYHASSVSSRPPFGFAPRRGPPRPAPPRPSGAGPRAPPDNQSRGGSLVVVRAGARESPNDLRRLRAPPAGSGTRRGGAAGAAHRNTQTQFACRRAADVGPARGRHPIPRAEHQKWTRALHSSGVLRYLFSMGMRL